MERFAAKAATLLSSVLPEPIAAHDLEIPHDRTMGDFAFPCFKLSKIRRLAPPQIALTLIKEMTEKDPSLQGLGVNATGPYINFSVPKDMALSALLPEIVKGPGTGTFGKLPEKTRGRWVIEFSSPNVAKPMHVGHLRTTVLGAALARVGAYRGYDVIRINHLGDWGTQFGKLAIAIERFGKDLPSQPTIEDLVKLYVEFHNQVEKHPELDEEAREAFHKIENGDVQMTALWKKCRDISLVEFEKTYKKLNVTFDHVWGESFYKPMLTPLIESFKKRGLLIESEGAWIVPVNDAKGRELTPCILQKKDGATIYATRDIAAAIYRYEQFAFDRMSYVVGGEQRLHFEQVFAVLRKAGHAWVSKCEHIPFGLYRFKDAKLSTRKGNVVTLEEVLQATQEKVLELMKARSKDFQGDMQEISEKIAIGAVVFFDLSSDPVRDVDFDLARVADFEGETGPYLQYAHTRCTSILRKAADEGFKSPVFDGSLLPLLKFKEEELLIKRLGMLPHHLERTLTYGKASQLTEYLIDVTKDFGAFYRECRVLGEDKSLSSARLMIVEATRRVLALSLSLLGIPLPEKM